MTLEELSTKTNRSLAQTTMLYNLLNQDLEKLKLLEVQIKNCHVVYCPADIDSVNEIMSLTPKTKYFQL